MTSELRGALIGCGFFARNQMHGWRDVEGARIVAVCDLDSDKAARMAADFDVAGIYTDAAAMLAEQELDFVDIATTAASHRQLACMTLEHGLPTICQKPFAETMADAKAMVDAANRAGKPLMVHENFRWERPLLELHRRLQDGLIGERRFAQISFRHAYDNYKNQPYLAEIERFAIMDVGLHLFDVARWLMGEVTSLFCRTQRLNPIVRGEDSFTASLRHENGAVSAVDCSFFSHLDPDPFPQTVIRLEGSQGTLELTRDYKLIVQHPGRHEVVDVEPATPAWGAPPWHCVQDSVIAIQRHWVEVLRRGIEPRPSGLDNLKTLTLAFAAYESAARDQAIDLSTFVVSE